MDNEDKIYIRSLAAVHPDMTSHTGTYMAFGKGMIDGSAKPQKINITTSMESEVGAM